MAVDPNHPLSEGLIGRQIVSYFKELDGRVAVDAESIDHVGEGQHDYRITFDSGIVQAYRVTFSDSNIWKSVVLDATPLN